MVLHRPVELAALTGHQIRFGANLGPKLGPTGPIFDSLAAEGQLNQRGLWSGRWESVHPGKEVEEADVDSGR